MELIFELIPAKLLAFLLALAFIAAGVYIWRGGSLERGFYEAAVGKESKTYQAEVRRKTVRSERSDNYNDSSDGSVDVNYLVLGFYEKDGQFSTVDAQVDRDEYDMVKEGDTIKISFHTDNPEYIVTPMKKRPGVFWHRLGGSIFVILGVIFILMLLASFGSD